MKKFTLLLVILLSSVMAFSQENDISKLQEIATFKSKGRIIMLNSEHQVPAEQFFSKYYEYFGFTSANDMVLKEKGAPRNGGQTYRYQQHYRGIPVEGNTLILHEKNGVVTYANGQFVSNFAAPFMPIFGADEAIALAISNTPAEQYAWQVEDLEKDLKELRNDPKATYAPQAKLVFYDPTHSTDARNYRLAYEIQVFAVAPLYINLIYVDATNGEILKVLKKNRNIDVTVQAQTRYDGIRTIVVDSVAADQFVLRENQRGAGNGIYTRSLNHNGSLLAVSPQGAVDVVESDNFFDTDVVANEAHFGAEMTYDYYYTNFGRNSLDNQGMRLMSYVHLGTDVDNACWSEGAMYYGDGSSGNEFTCLSICGHEITHGLTEHTANLIYEDEPGALNESFSDMFGVAITHYTLDTLNWQIGSEIGMIIRDMSDPNSNDNPDTYLGNYWEAPGTTSDNGVHTNSGVGNYWFYLLCAGGEGINDNGTYYNVQPIGIEKAGQIAFYTLTENLIETSDYSDTRELSLMVAADIYGDCSDEVISVAEAWNAVGLGHRYSDSAVYVASILSPATGCALTDAEPIVVELDYNSCSAPLLPGTEIQFKIMADENSELLDTLVLSDTIEANSLVMLTLNRTINASEVGEHTLQVFAKLGFVDTYSDSLTYHFTNKIYQNSDLHIVDLVSPVSSCTLNETTPIVCAVTFDICDSIAAGDSIRVGYRLNTGDTIAEWIVLDHSVTSADTILVTFTQTADFTETVKTTVRILALQPDDTDNSDNYFSRVVIKPRSLNTLGTITFNESDANQYYYTETGEYASLSVGTMNGYDGGKLVKMSGGNVMNYYGEIEFPESDWWDANPKMNSRITFCADASDFAQFAVQFDLKQTTGASMYEQTIGTTIPGLDLRQSSMMHVLLDGEPVSENYIPTTMSDDPFQTRAINLSDHIGSMHSLTFEAKCISNDLFTFVLDHVYIDNVAVLESNSILNFSEGNATLLTYPNPTQRIVMLQTSGIDNDAQYQLFDISGRMLQQKRIVDETMVLDLGDYATGIYILKVVSNGQLIGTSKIVKE